MQSEINQYPKNLSEEDSCESTKEEYVKNYIGCTRNCKTSSIPAWMCSGPSTTGCICKYPYFRDDKFGECVRKEDCQNLNKRENHFGPNPYQYHWGFIRDYTTITSGKI